jgi:hypothetical protein
VRVLDCSASRFAYPTRSIIAFVPFSRILRSFAIDFISLKKIEKWPAKTVGSWLLVDYRPVSYDFEQEQCG